MDGLRFGRYHWCFVVIMQNNKDAKLWFSLHALGPYQGNEPPFIEPVGADWQRQLELAAEVIRTEFEAFLKQVPPKPYFKKNMASRSGDWITVPLMTWGLCYRKRWCHFPHTLSVLRNIDGLVSVSFNILKSGASIAPHFGDTNAATRFHLGLKVPAGLPSVGLQVHDELRGWQEGKLLGFCDGYLHRAWNHSNGDRYILLLDVMRPEFLHVRRRVCATVLSSLVLQLAIQTVPPLKSLLLLPLRLAAATGATGALLLTPCYNLIGKMLHRKREPDDR